MFVGGIHERTGGHRKGGTNVLEEEEELVKALQRDQMIWVLQDHKEFNNRKGSYTCKLLGRSHSCSSNLYD